MITHESSLKRNGRKLSALQSSVYHRDPALASEIAAGSQLLLLLLWLLLSQFYGGSARRTE